jgi:hypothetical protein
MEFLTGKDYPWLCEECRGQVDRVAALFAEGAMPDTDNPEAPCDYVYDNRLFCGDNGAYCRGDEEEEDCADERMERNMQDPGYIYDLTHGDDPSF